MVRVTIVNLRIFIRQRRQQPGCPDCPSIVGIHAQEVDSRLSIMPDVCTKIDLRKRRKTRDCRQPARTDLEPKQNYTHPGGAFVQVHFQGCGQKRLDRVLRHLPVEEQHVQPLLRPRQSFPFESVGRGRGRLRLNEHGAPEAQRRVCFLCNNCSRFACITSTRSFRFCWQPGRRFRQAVQAFRSAQEQLATGDRG